jgi:hypothetical protein
MCRKQHFWILLWMAVIWFHLWNSYGHHAGTCSK